MNLNYKFRNLMKKASKVIELLESFERVTGLIKPEDY